MAYIVTSPWWLRLAFSKHCIWEMPGDSRSLYLSFDDGPHPEITPFVLDALKKHNAKATFFCIGNNVEKYPEVYRRILDEGHRVGNHTYSHYNSKQTEEKIWLEDVKAASKWIDSDLFRPPYGRISRFQEKVLREANPGYRTIMWSVLSGDFDKNIRGNDCARIVKSKSQSGSIVVFHDSEKAWERLREALPTTLEHFANQGFNFKNIP